MMYDDLTAPLGQDQAKARSPRYKAVMLAGFLGGIGLLAGSTTYLFERVSLHAPATEGTIISLPMEAVYQKPVTATGWTPAPQEFARGTESNTKNPLPEPSANPAPARIETATDAIEKQTGVKITRVGGGGAPEALVIDVAKELNRSAPASADFRIMEQSRYGPIPRIGADGARPSRNYARPSFSPGEANSPAIALVVGGLGLAAQVTETAIAALPPEVTLGFAPYGSDLARQSAHAHEIGHEIVLQVPMEPFDFPANSPGPHTLVTGTGKAANIDNLTWLMSRVTGYIGVMNFLGGKFVADEKALAPVLREIAARGLVYLDDGSSSQTKAVTLASNLGLAAARADIVLDLVPQPEAIEAALTRLESIAREKGVAIGVASALPGSISVIGRYARALESRGVSLIPLSAAIPDRQGGMADSTPMK